MRRGVFAAVILVALVVPAAASAHATLKEVHPGEQDRVDAPPSEVTLRFDQSVEAPPNAIVVLAPDGRTLSGPVSQSRRGTVVRVPVHGAVGGQAYTVRWRVVSADGHPVSGAVPFRLTVAGPGSAVPAAAMTASPAGTGSMPWWPWITGGAGLLGTGVAVARRLARADA